MTLEVSFAGVTLPPTPGGEIAAWLAANHDIGWVAEFVDRTWPGKNQGRLGFQAAIHKMPLQFGTLSWPVGASRFAVAHFYVTDNRLARIRQVTGGSNYSAQPLILDDGWPNQAHRVTASQMWMLPARPLAQNAPGLQGYILTLVDDRFWWWYKAATITVTGGTTTWSDLYGSLGAALGFNILNDTVSADYLKPAQEFTGRQESLPNLLDAVAESVGQRIVMGLDGSVYAYNVATSISKTNAQVTDNLRIAGGTFLFAGTDPQNDLPGTLPQEVVVAFPRADGYASGTTNWYPSASLSLQTISLSSLSLAEFSAANTAPFSKRIHSSCLAYYATSAGSTPTNNTELNTLAKRIARDWYYYRLVRLEQTLVGTVPWTLEGLHDLQWSFAEPQPSLLLTPREWDGGLEELLHHGTYGSVGREQVMESVCQTQGDFAFANQSTRFFGYLHWPPFTPAATLSSSQNDYQPDSSAPAPPASQAVWYRLTSSADINITGWKDGLTADRRDGRLLVVTNYGPHTITLKHQSGSSAAANRFAMSDGSDIALTQNHIAAFIYDKATGNWRELWRDQGASGSSVPDYSYTVSGKTNLSGGQVAKGTKFWANGIGWTADNATAADADFTMVRDNYLVGSNAGLTLRQWVDEVLVDVRAASFTLWTSFNVNTGPYNIRWERWTGSTQAYGGSFTWIQAGASPVGGETAAGNTPAHVVKITYGFENFSGDDLAFTTPLIPPDLGSIWLSGAGYFYARLGYVTDDGAGALAYGETVTINYKKASGSNGTMDFINGLLISDT